MVLETLKKINDIVTCGSAGLVTGVMGGLYIPIVAAAYPINLAAKFAIVRGKGEQFDTTTKFGEFLDTSMKRAEWNDHGTEIFSEGIRFQRLLYNAFRDTVYGKKYSDPNDTCNQVADVAAAFGSTAGVGAGAASLSLALIATAAVAPGGIMLMIAPAVVAGTTAYIEGALERSERGLSYSELPPAKKKEGTLAPTP